MKPYPPDGGLKAQVRDPKDGLSAFAVMKEFFDKAGLVSVVVGSDEELDRAVSDAKAKGLRIACVSNAGLEAPRKRITFLPENKFVTRKPGWSMTSREPRDVRDIVAEIDRDAALPGKEV